MVNDNHPINDSSAHIIWFETSTGSDKIRAGVVWEVLRTRFGAGSEEESLLLAYYDNSRMLHAVAQRKFLDKHPLPVLLNPTDFPTERRFSY